MKKFIFLVFIGLAVGSIFAFSSNPAKELVIKQKQLSDELTVLRLINNAVAEKFVPDSLKNLAQKASHDLMCVQNGSDDYWYAMKDLQTVDAFVNNNEQCAYMAKLIKEKENELAELSNVPNSFTLIP